MDPYAEKELIQVLKNISSTLNEMRDELTEISLAIREAGNDSEEVEEELQEN